MNGLITISCIWRRLPFLSCPKLNWPFLMLHHIALKILHSFAELLQSPCRTHSFSIPCTLFHMRTTCIWVFSLSAFPNNTASAKSETILTLFLHYVFPPSEHSILLHSTPVHSSVSSCKPENFPIV